MKQLQRIAFIVDSEFFVKHVGVRSYVLNLIYILNINYLVDIIELLHLPCGTAIFKEVIIKKLYLKSLNFTTDTLNNKVINKIEVEQPLYQALSTKALVESKYDAIIFSNAWMIHNHNIDISTTTKTFGIMYDTIPNEYYLQKYNNIHLPLHDFAHLHYKGFSYFNKFCHKILCISEKSKTNYNILFPSSQNKTVSIIPPMNSYYFDIKINTNRKNVIILSTPLETRKGIDILPDLINGIAYIDEVIIYGDTDRSTPHSIKQFFKKLRKDIPVNWYKKITVNTLATCFNKSKLLICASSDEGLGIPIIEAQLCGCQIICYNKAPMNTITANNIYLVENDTKTSIDNINTILANTVDHNKIAQKAREKYKYEKVLKYFDSII